MFFEMFLPFQEFPLLQNQFFQIYQKMKPQHVLYHSKLHLPEMSDGVHLCHQSLHQSKRILQEQ